MFGKMFDIMGKLDDAKKNVIEARKRLDEKVIESEAGNGLVKVSVTGNKNLKSLNIADEALKDKDMLEDYLSIALNKALDEAGKIQEAELKKAAMDALPNIPGLDGLL
jgi:DNA-binding YbaB/EbfC family protein